MQNRITTCETALQRACRGRSVALLLGIFGIATGIEAVYYATKVGPSGYDFTGLALGAGVVLLGLGLVTLWTTRRREGSVPRRVLRRTAIAAASLVGALFVVFPLGYAYVGTHVARPPVASIDLGGAPTADVELHTGDGLTLEGPTCPRRTAPR